MAKDPRNSSMGHDVPSPSDASDEMSGSLIRGAINELASEAESRAAVPPRLLDYELLRVIGEGSIGTVWLSRRRLDDHYCAVKVFSSRASTEIEGLREYSHRISEHPHPHLLPIEHVGQVEDTCYCVMPLADDACGSTPVCDIEHYEALTLARAIRRQGCLPVEDVLEIGKQILGALIHLHRQGARHGDVKPDNILKRLKLWNLSDHGLMTNPERSDFLGGTPAYCPPEGPGGTTSDDIYALGVTLFQAATGQEPRLVVQICVDGDLELRGDSSLVERLTSFVKETCAAEPSHRATSDQDALEILAPSENNHTAISTSLSHSAELMRSVSPNATAEIIRTPRYEEMEAFLDRARNAWLNTPLMFHYNEHITLTPPQGDDALIFYSDTLRFTLDASHLKERRFPFQYCFALADPRREKENSAEAMPFKGRLGDRELTYEDLTVTEIDFGSYPMLQCVLDAEVEIEQTLDVWLSVAGYNVLFDNSEVMYVRYPCKGFSAALHYLPEYDYDYSWFAPWLDSTSHLPSMGKCHTVPNGITVASSEWLLPGCGVVLTWHKRIE